MFTNEFNPRPALLVTRIMYFAMIAGMLLFLAVALYITKAGSYFKADFSDPFLIILIIMSITVLPLGSFISARVLPNSDPNETFRSRYSKYQTRLIIRLATCEGVGLFAVTCFLINPNMVFLLFLLIALFIMSLYYPTPEKIGSDLNLTQTEVESFTQF
jgi:hypothetical protein